MGVTLLAAVLLGGCAGVPRPAADNQQTGAIEVGKPDQSPSQSGPSGSFAVRLPFLPPDLTPTRRDYQPGETVPARGGVYLIEPSTGAVEAWDVYAGENFQLQISPGGRYLTAAGSADPVSNTLVTSLFDTHTGAVHRFLGVRPGRFSVNERRLWLVGEAQLLIVSLPEGVVEQKLTPDRLWWSWYGVYGGAWSPNGESLLASVIRLPRTGSTISQLMRLDSPHWAPREITSAESVTAGWSPDGRRYLVRSAERIEARDAGDDRTVWQFAAAEVGLSVMRSWYLWPSSGTEAGQFSPDSSAVTVTVAPAGDRLNPADVRTYVLDFATGRALLRVDTAVTCGHAWTADSRWLRVAGWVDGRYGVVQINPADGHISAFDYAETYASPVTPGVTTQSRRVELGAVLQINLTSVAPGTGERQVRIRGTAGFDVSRDSHWLTDGRLVASARHNREHRCFTVGSYPDLRITVLR